MKWGFAFGRQAGSPAATQSDVSKTKLRRGIALLERRRLKNDLPVKH